MLVGEAGSHAPVAAHEAHAWLRMHGRSQPAAVTQPAQALGCAVDWRAGLRGWSEREARDDSTGAEPGI